MFRKNFGTVILVLGVIALVVAFAVRSYQTTQQRIKAVTVVPKAKSTRAKARETLSPQTDKKPVKRPRMPLEPLGKGALEGVVVILDAGHGGQDPGCSWQETFRLKGRSRRVCFWEAAYTARMVGELASLVRHQGAEVYLTTYSSALEVKPSAKPQVAEPLPRDAVFMWDGKIVTAGQRGLSKRTKFANHVAKKRAASRVVFLSLHIDSMPAGYKGAHVCIDSRHRRGKPTIATAIAKRLVAKGYGRKRGHKALISVKARSLAVLRHNFVSERCLVELATPVNDSDSFRMRSQPHRQKMLRLITEAIIEVFRRGPAKARVSFYSNYSLNKQRNFFTINL